MIRHYTLLRQQADPRLSQFTNLTEEVCECLANTWDNVGNCSGLFITRDGIDGRLPVAFEVSGAY